MSTTPFAVPQPIDALFDQYFNQTLTVEGLAQLEEWLLADPAHADAFARAGLTHGLTREVMMRQLRQWKKRKRLPWRPVALTAAGVVLAVGAGLMVSRRTMRSYSMSQAPAAPAMDDGQSAETSGFGGLRSHTLTLPDAATPAPADTLYADKTESRGGQGIDATAPTIRPAIIRSAQLRLRAADAYATARQVEALADAMGGFAASNHSEGQNHRAAHARVDIRIPAPSLDQARAKIRAMGLEVLADSASASEVSAQLVDLAARITNLETAEKELRQIVTRVGEKTNNTGELMTAYRELTRVREQIEVLRAQEKNLKDRVAMSAVTVEIFESPPPPSAPAGWNAARPFQSAWAMLIGLGQDLWSLAAYALVIGLPLLLIVGLPAWGIWKLAQREKK